ncbi:unnamed protein product [Parnassius apollo]|uniref:(apollo) hypothetical protein n=1 Tax=Parnassius apollo TaxID=110799 RepID=A0A8S3XPP5_PARAO|nr:unnamed protein product [Parnassius apollo]
MKNWRLESNGEMLNAIKKRKRKYSRTYKIPYYSFKKIHISESKQKIRKKLLETRVLEESLKETYNDSKSNEEKNVLKKLLVSESRENVQCGMEINLALLMQQILKKYLSLKGPLKIMSMENPIHAKLQRKLYKKKKWVH